MTTSLLEISKLLESVIVDPQAKIYTFAEFGYDETNVIATGDGYLLLAKECIDFVAKSQRSELKKEVFDGIQCHSESIRHVMSPICWDPALDNFHLVESEVDAEKMTRYFQSFDHPQPNFETPK